MPYAFEETKPGVIPGRYYIPQADDKDTPGILHVSNGRSDMYLLDGRTIPFPCPAEEIAKSLVNDFNLAQLEADPTSHPALFYVNGTYTAAEVILRFKDKVEEAKKLQVKWFSKLIRRADDDWNKWKQHRMITDIQRHAAKELGMINKEWYHSPQPEEFVKCPACATLVESSAVICKNCQFVINKEKAKELGVV